MKEEILKKTAKEYFDSGGDEFKKERYNSSLVLYFKALIAAVDLIIYQKTGNTPSSHNERFRITQDRFTELYELLDKDFPFYQDSYVQVMSKELTEVLRDDAKVVAKKAGIEISS